MDIFIALDSDRLILGVFTDRQDAVDECERDWVASGGKRDGYHWDGDSLINTAYQTSVRWVYPTKLQ